MCGAWATYMISSNNGAFNAVDVYDLDLWLYQVIDNEATLIASSTSDTANTENIWASLEAGGDYFFRVDTTKNLVALLNTLGDSGIAALIVILALMITYRRLLK